MNKKHNIILFIFISLTFLIFAGCTKDNGRADCLRFGVLRVEDALPVFIADRQKLFVNDVEVIVFSNTREMDLALEAGVIDGILSDIVRSILLKGGQEDIRIIASASENSFEKRKFALMSSPTSEIYTYGDLVNREIAISNNSIISFLAEKMLENKDIKGTLVSFKAIPDIKLRFESLINNSIDSAILPEPLVTIAEKEGARVIISDIELDKKYSQTVYIFRKSYIEEYPERIKNFLVAVEFSGKLINNSPEKYYSLISEKAGVPKELLEEYKIRAVQEIRLPEKEIISEINDWMVKKEITSLAISYEDLVTDIFVGELE